MVLFISHLAVKLCITHTCLNNKLTITTKRNSFVVFLFCPHLVMQLCIAHIWQDFQLQKTQFLSCVLSTFLTWSCDSA